MSAIPRIAILASSLLAASAFAGTDTSTFDVTATVTGSCNIVSTATVAFGEYDPAGAHLNDALDGAGSVTVRCVRGTQAIVALEQGNAPATGSSCTTPLRQMSAGDQRLAYQLFRDTARSQVWGCDASNTQAFTAASPSTPTVLTTYGRVAGGQDVLAGSYTDTVTVTVTF